MVNPKAAFDAFRAPGSVSTPGAAPLVSEQKDFESFEVQPKLVNPTNSQAAGVAVYSFRNRWSGVEILMSTGPSSVNGNSPFGAVPSFNASIGAQLFARVGSIRTLVASGRFSGGDYLAGLRSKRLIAYGGHAANYEVELSWRKLTADASNCPFSMTGIGCDAPVARTDEQNVGVMTPFQGDLMTNAAAQTIPIESPAEIVGFAAVANVTPRWLMFFDSSAGPPVPNGTAPLLSVKVPTADTATVGYGPSPFVDLRVLRARRFTTQIQICVSSTPGTLTLGANNDVFWTVYLR